MPVLGVGGTLELKREAPSPVVITSRALDDAHDALYLRNPSFWSGDEVALSCANGLPIDTGTDGPDCPDGHAAYSPSVWLVGPNRTHITADTNAFYTPEDDRDFYVTPARVGLTTYFTAFIHRDALDRISFYPTKAAALYGHVADRIPLAQVDFNGLIISSVGPTKYQALLQICAQTIHDASFPPSPDEFPLAPFAPEADGFTHMPEVTTSSWLIQALLSSWSLQLSSREVDTTALGERFGDAVKSLITGGGVLDFMLDRAYHAPTEQDSATLLQLLLLTDKGCKAEARFYMIRDREARCGLLPGSLYYDATLMITSSAVNTSASDLIAGSLNFVTVGEIALKVAV